MKNPIFDIENWREIGTTLAQNKTRTFMTGFGIFWGTAMLALLLGGAEGLKHFMSRNFEGFATNAATIFPERTTKSYAGFNKGMALEMNLQDADNIRRAIPDIENSSSVNFMWANALYGDKKSNAQLTGVENKYDKIFEPIIFDGRFLNEADNANYRKVCVLGKKVASELFGTASGVGNDIQLNGIYYKVIGVVGQTSEITIGANMDESIFIPSSSMRRSYNLGDRIDIFMMTFRQGTKPGNYEKQLRRIIASNHPIAPDDDGAFHYFNISEMFEMVDNVFAGITLLALVVGTGTLMSGVIGVGNIMWIIVRERTHEIGIRRAIGAKPRDIIVQILSESMVLTTIAGIAGIVFAAILLGAAEILTAGPQGPIKFQMDFSQAIGILATFLVLGTAAGIIPAVKAMKIKPIEALNDK
ncbi:ABC transporter permease [uncultured Duncaniella sp.]|uniref:ABC transporter permease n=1 Tax=uncultured Duncaniella sp. TaxID=2768039 RepID=UPI00266ECF88|nr:ABC transporter permease [uncultured Duncaniella sp.]